VTPVGPDSSRWTAETEDAINTRLQQRLQMPSSSAQICITQASTKPKHPLLRNKQSGFSCVFVARLVSQCCIFDMVHKVSPPPEFLLHNESQV